jgi:DNA-binding CsgD family transcriptional regulator
MMDSGASELYAASVLGVLELSLGRFEAAAGHLGRCAELAVDLDPVHLTIIAFEPDYVEALVALGRKSEAQEAARHHHDRVRRSGSASGLATAARCRGLVADPDAFEREFETALVLHRVAPVVFDVARTRLCFGERLRRARRPTAARQELAAALASFEQLHTTPWVERARRELDATGITRARRRHPDTGDDLTGQELQVALIIAKGATVREAAARMFLSPKTIESHLGRTYRKLGVRNRAQLVIAIASQHTTDG